ncbi:putative transmembrane region and signal peptide protein [Rhodopirellula islandica]|uniref:Transmembrane region and signal peptide protein n=1 Tax=Rhodopirellula islandica TaxID=595434 RepID=A0A0J1B577_RHOIS|nr:hypothetical protein [Rhodopirellula islandica]KLU01965.1 putative transmembrane region and signal peptide protein [Rhodopirellula islandica]
MKRFQHLALLGVVALIAGCGGSEVAENDASQGSGADSAYLASSEPADAMPVGEAREKAGDGEELTLVGLIGGSADPFVDGLAAFTIVDPNVPYCADDEGCPTPWDYCCTQDQVKDNIATVKVVDESGAPVSKTARDLLGVNELATVVVHGIAKRDDQGNLTVEASDVFVRSSK